MTYNTPIICRIYNPLIYWDIIDPYGEKCGNRVIPTPRHFSNIFRKGTPNEQKLVTEAVH